LRSACATRSSRFSPSRRPRPVSKICREADGQIALEVAPVDAVRVPDQETAPLLLRQAAELQAHQRVGFGLDGDRRVDFPQQVAGAQVLEVLTKIDGRLGAGDNGFGYGGHGGFLLIGFVVDVGKRLRRFPSGAACPGVNRARRSAGFTEPGAGVYRAEAS
jgi:hypothetical protein